MQLNGIPPAGVLMRGELKVNEPLSRHTTWRVGGPAERFYQPADLDDLAAFLAQLPASEPLTWLGLGSNLLVRDGGVAGTVISLALIPDNLQHTGELTISANAGVACAKLARFSAEVGLTGAEFLAGIPGTLGGALAMNAGAWGGETWTIIDWVDVMNRHGQRQRLHSKDFEIGYRSVKAAAECWFVAAGLRLQPDIDAQARQRIRDLLAERGASQPMGLPSCGSVFRNPPGDHAGRLIEQAGLKGFRIGAAGVAEKHANFIINHGGASAADIEALIEHVRQTIRVMTGIELIPEVRVIGEVLPERNEDDRL
ncbi:MAG: UDP-N-acetylmuramate dehydrogenase [Gammaproteobacteria bacterium]